MVTRGFCNGVGSLIGIIQPNEIQILHHSYKISVIGRAGASPPSRTNGMIFLFIRLIIYNIIIIIILYIIIISYI